MRDVQRLRRQRQTRTLYKHGKGIRIEEVTSEGKGRRLMVVIGQTPGFRVLLAHLLTMRFVHNKGEQAPTLRAEGPERRPHGSIVPDRVEEGVGARLFGIDGP